MGASALSGPHRSPSAYRGTRRRAHFRRVHSSSVKSALDVISRAASVARFVDDRGRCLFVEAHARRERARWRDPWRTQRGDRRRPRHRGWVRSLSRLRRGSRRSRNSSDSTAISATSASGCVTRRLGLSVAWGRACAAAARRPRAGRLRPRRTSCRAPGSASRAAARRARVSCASPRQMSRRSRGPPSRGRDPDRVAP
jgi:hypothetical protein